MQRDRTNIDNNLRDDRQIDGLPGIFQVPIESDADAGFAHRSRKAKAARPRNTLSEAPDTSTALRNRGSLSRRAQIAAGTRRQQEAQQEKSYATTLTDRFRHVRSSSLTAFTSPFRRSSRSSTQVSTPEEEEHEEEEPRRKSQMSISKWFGGASDTSSEEEEDGSGNGSVGNGEGDETPLFGTDAFQGSALDDEADLSPGLEEPIPGGEWVDQQTIEAGAAAGEGFVQPTNGDRGYSPPRQDQGWKG